jgi:hypothetical protein
MLERRELYVVEVNTECHEAHGISEALELLSKLGASLPPTTQVRIARKDGQGPVRVFSIKKSGKAVRIA